MVADEPAASRRLLTFSVGRGRFAVALDSVLGVQDAVGAPARGGGDVMFQGRLVRTVHARCLGWGGADAPAWDLPPAAIIVGSEDSEATALVVDRVDGIVDGLDTQPLPELVSSFARGVFCRVALHGEERRLVVDPAAIPGVTGKRAAEDGRGGPEGA